MTDNNKQLGTGLLEPLYEDPRNIPLSAAEEPIGADDLPESHMTDTGFLGVNDQGSTGSCVGQSTSKMKEYQEYIEDNVNYAFSPRYVYALCKKIDGYNGWGTFLKTGLSVANTYGSARKDVYFPDDVHLPDEQYRDWRVIPQSALTEGENFKTGGYAYVYRGDLNAIKSALVTHGVLVGGFKGSNEGVRISDPSNPMIRPPTSNESQWGHAVLFKGYEPHGNTGKTRLWFQNSWGDDWGKNGEGYLVFEDYPWLFDLWLSTDLPSELIDKARSMIPLIKGNERPEVYAHNTKKNYKAWVNAEVLMNWMGTLWGENGWDLAKLMAEYVREIPQAEADKLREVDLFVGKVQV